MYNNIIGIFGVPRSGTSWLGQIFDSCPNIIYKFQPLFSYAFKDRLNVYSTKDDIQKFFNELYFKKDDFLDQIDKRTSNSYPKFKIKMLEPDILTFKEVRYLYIIPHLLKEIENIKIVFIVRNPVNVIESWINAPKEFKPEWNIEDEWYFGQSKNEFKPENYYGYIKWKESVKMYNIMKILYPNKIILVRYEDLNKNAIEKTKELFNFCNVNMEKQTYDFIIESQSKSVDDAYGVFRKKDIKYKRKYDLPQKVKELIENDLKSFKEAKDLEYI